MVAVANVSKSLYAAVAYNEKKLKEGKANLLQANGYAKDIEQLSFQDKWQRLQKQADLFAEAKTNCIHISLNFDPSEHPDKEKLCAIANRYLEGIGFANQPFLLYEHKDAGHPHVHIVTTTIRTDGTRIPTHNIGRNESSAVRRQIEKEFGLVKADDHKQAVNAWQEHIVNAHAVKYGSAATKAQMANAIRYVFNKYKFTTLQEYNTVLRNFNVIVSRGEKGSRTHSRGGLFYRALEEGKPVGKPIKASDFYFNPTLSKLEEKFKSYLVPNQQDKRRITNAVNYAFLKNTKQSLQDLTDALSREAIQLFQHRNASGVLYGLTYIDHTTGAVFNGRSLGPNFSANAIQKRCSTEHIDIDSKRLQPDHISQLEHSNQTGLIEELIQPDKSHLLNPSELHNDKKKRPKKVKL